ncbi:hypothetical protein ACROYT_G039663 [Oculina patagonica]
MWLKLLIDSNAFVVGTIYRPPSDGAFYERFHEILEKVWMKYKNVVIVGDFNCDYAQRNGDIVLSTTGNLVIASRAGLIRTTYLELGISDHMDLEDALWSVCSAFDDPDDCYWAWSNIFNDICNRHAPYREVKIRSQSLPWITPQIRHTMNQRFKILLMARRTNNEELWKIYRELRNKVTLDVRKAKCKYYTELFAEKALFKLKPDKASGPDHVSSKLLKYAGNVIIPSLMSVFTASTASNSVPATWKLANVSSLYKSGDETDKHNYRPISLLSVPGKLMESCIGSIITTHITNHT